MSVDMDMSKVSMGFVTNIEGMKLLKNMSGRSQQYYPEHTMRILVMNGGWSFTAIWKILKPLLDKRVQEKVQVVKTIADVQKWLVVAEMSVDFVKDLKK